MSRAGIAGAVALMVVGAWAGSAWTDWRHADPDAETAERYRRQVRINDSTVVVLAGKDAKIRELEGLAVAARQVNGRLVAGFKAHLELHAASGAAEGSEAPADTASDSTRTWDFRSENPFGVLEANVAVPPYPRPPVLRYRIFPAAIEPSVGFVRVGQKYLAVVTCDVCSQVRVEAPFVDPAQLRPEPRLSRWVGGQWDAVADRWTARAGMDFRLGGGMSLGLEGRRILRRGEDGQLLVGFVKRF